MSDTLHPNTESLSELTYEELEEKYTKLMHRWQIAKRMQMGESIAYQLDLLLNAIDEEKIRRNISDEKPNGVILDTDPIKIDFKKRF